jgi:hypothetical protein
MYQRGAGKATNSVSRTASERGKSAQRPLHSRAQLHGQEPKKQLADVPERRRKGNELGQPNSIRARHISANVLHIRAQLHGQEPKQLLADVPKMHRESNELGQPNSVRARQVSAIVLHIRAQLHGQEPKQLLAEVPERRQEGNELRQPNCIRMRASQRKVRFRLARKLTQAKWLN